MLSQYSSKSYSTKIPETPLLLMSKSIDSRQKNSIGADKDICLFWEHRQKYLAGEIAEAKQGGDGTQGSLLNARIFPVALTAPIADASYGRLICENMK